MDGLNLSISITIASLVTDTPSGGAPLNAKYIIAQDGSNMVSESLVQLIIQ